MLSQNTVVELAVLTAALALATGIVGLLKSLLDAGFFKNGRFSYIGIVEPI